MGMSLPKIAVLASGRGSNFEALQAAIEEGRLNAEISVVLSNKESAPVLEKASRKKLNAKFMAAVGKEDWSLGYVSEIKKAGAQYVALAGFMKILPDSFIQAFDSGRGYSRIVNVHPSLLPAFPGVDSYRQAFESGSKTTGVTVHLVDTTLDGGPICAQESFSIADCKSAEEVEARGLKIEHRLFPETLNWILTENFKIEGGRRCVRTS